MWGLVNKQIYDYESVTEIIKKKYMFIKDNIPQAKYVAFLKYSSRSNGNIQEINLVIYQSTYLYAQKIKTMRIRIWV